MYEVTLPKSEKCHFCVFLSQEKEDTPRLLGTADYKIIPYNIHIGFYIFDRSMSLTFVIVCERLFEKKNENYSLLSSLSV